MMKEDTSIFFRPEIPLNQYWRSNVSFWCALVMGALMSFSVDIYGKGNGEEELDYTDFDYLEVVYTDSMEYAPKTEAFFSKLPFDLIYKKVSGNGISRRVLRYQKGKLRKGYNSSLRRLRRRKGIESVCIVIDLNKKFPSVISTEYDVVKDSPKIRWVAMLHGLKRGDKEGSYYVPRMKGIGLRMLDIERKVNASLRKGIRKREVPLVYLRSFYLTREAVPFLRNT